MSNYGLSELYDYESNYLQELDSYELATEGNIKNAIGSLKEKVNKLIYRIRKWLQMLASWVRTKFAQLAQKELITIDIDFYNEIMSFIRGIDRIGNGIVNNVKLSIAHAKAVKATDDSTRQEAVSKLNDILNGCKQDLELLNDAKNKIPEPKEGGKKVSIYASKVTSMKTRFEEDLKKGQEIANCLPQLAAAIQIADSSDDRNVQYACRLAYTVNALYSNIIITRANMCIQLINSLISHGQSSIPQNK